MVNKKKEKLISDCLQMRPIKFKFFIEIVMILKKNYKNLRRNLKT